MVKSGFKRIVFGITVVFVMLINTTVTPFAETVSFSDGSSAEKITYENNEIYYSDDYFRSPSTEYDPHLSAVSMYMTYFSNTELTGKPTDMGDAEWYKGQSKYVKGYFEKLGFGDFAANEDYKKRTAFNTIGVAAASKKIDDYTVIGLTIRSQGYYLEWANNVYSGDGSKSDYMHEGWYNTAKKSIDFLNGYIKDKNITGKIKLWVCGYSRGGAASNLIAGLLDNRIDADPAKVFDADVSLENKDLYVYTFEAPQGANINSKTVKAPKANYDANILTTLLFEELVKNVGSREDFCRKLQEPLKTLMELAMSDDASGTAALGQEARTIWIFLLVNGVTQLVGDVLDYSDSVRDLYVKEVTGKKDLKVANAMKDAAAALAPILAKTYDEKPNELLSMVIGADGVMQNHEMFVTLAYVQAQDSYFTEAYNKAHNTKLSAVGLRDNADYVRLSFYGYNTIKIPVGDSNAVVVEGSYSGKSKVVTCKPGFAVGYYSYDTEEKMELFCNIADSYTFKMNCSSKKPYHRVEYWAYHSYLSIGEKGVYREQKDHFKEKVWFGWGSHDAAVSFR